MRITNSLNKAHNLDSQIANYICENVDWVISNHDSWTVHPNSVSKVRRLYVQKITELYHNRKEILRRYFRSIGITEEYPEKNQEEVKEFSGYCLK